MTIKRHWLITAAAVVVALGAGFGAARLMDGGNDPDVHADEEEHGEEGGGDFVALSTSEAAEAGITVVAVGRGGGSELILPGRVEFAPGAEALVDGPLPGTVTQVHVAVGSRVQVGSPLVTLRSPDGAAARAEVDAAQAAAEVARNAAERDRSLFERGFVAEQRLEGTEAQLRQAEAELRAARARLAAYGGPPNDGLVVVRSPTAGVVTNLFTALGSVLTDEELGVAAVADARRVELVFQASPGASGRLRVGESILARTADGQEIGAVITAIAPAAEAGTVTVRARPTGGTPPAGTVLSGRIVTGGGGALVVPTDAIQTLEGVTSVFVAEGEGFRAHPVITGQTAGGMTEIVSGLDGSERIAGAGAFLLKAELSGGSMEDEH